MKTIIKIFTAVLAVVPVLVSCYSEPLPEVIPEAIPEDGDNGSEQDSTVRVITVSFNTKATRTVFDETTRIPSFEKDDVIAVTDGNGNMEECPVYITESGYARINITEAALKDVDVIAVYPASVYIPNEPYFVVPSVQDGTFANANICKTTIKAGATSAVFENQTAVFRIELPETSTNWSQIMSLNVKSLGRIENGQRGNTRAKITNDSEYPYDIRLIEKKYIDEEGDECHFYYNNPIYVSVLCDADGTDDDVQLVDLNFDIYYYRNYDPDGDVFHTVRAQGGFSPYFLGTKSIPLDATVAPNSFYSGVESHLHEYFNSGQVSWAREYLGPAGDDTSEIGYFMWGETTGHAAAAASGTNAFVTGFTDNTKGFATANQPFNGYTTDDFINNKIVWTTPNPEHPGTETLYILSLEYDAAYQNWGGAWRMPRRDDNDSFDNNVFDWDRNKPYELYYDRDDETDNIISFTNVGTGSGTSLSSDSKPIFWTSCLDPSNPTRAFVNYLSTTSTIIFNTGSSTVANKGARYYGHAIRPVSGNEIQ